MISNVIVSYKYPSEFPHIMSLVAFILIYLLVGVVLTMVYEAIWLDTLEGEYGVCLGAYHLHHSLFGIVAYLLGIIVLMSSSVMALGFFCVGTGIIIQHTIREGHFTFLS